MSFFNADVLALLQKPLIARMAVIDFDGYPHSVPVWYMLDGDDLVITSFRDTRKIEYLRANPRGSLVIGGEDEIGVGYLIKGDLTVEDDSDWSWQRKITLLYEDPATAEAHLAEWSQQPAVLIRLHPRKIIKVY